MLVLGIQYKKRQKEAASLEIKSSLKCLQFAQIIQNVKEKFQKSQSPTTHFLMFLQVCFNTTYGENVKISNSDTWKLKRELFPMTTEYKLKKKNQTTIWQLLLTGCVIILTIEGRGRPLLIPTIYQSYYSACAQCQMPKDMDMVSLSKRNK